MPLHDFHVVGHQDHGQTSTLLQCTQQGEKLRPQRAVEGGGGFVGEQDVRVVGQGHGDEDALLLSTRQFVRIGTHRPVQIGHLHLLEEASGLVHGHLSVQTRMPAEDPLELTAAPHGRIQARHGFLEHHGDAVPSRNGHEFLTRSGGPRLPQALDAARSEAPSVGQHAQGGHAAQGLPRPALPHEREAFAPVHSEVDVLQDGPTPDVEADLIPQEGGGGVRGCHAGPARVRWLRKAP